MTTVNTIVERSLRRLRLVGVGQSVAAADAATGRDILNSMLARWPALGVEPYYTALALTDTFAFFAPPAAATSEVIDALAYQGTWDASANSPTLASSSGTKGYFYKVSTAGSTTLDSVTSWAANDYAVFDGTVWLKSINSARFEQAVIDLLAMELTADFGTEPAPMLVQSARRGWSEIQAAFLKAPTATFDRAIRDTMVREYDLDETIT